LQVIENHNFDQERALYGIKGAIVRNCKFDGPADGESALKETSCMQINGCYMNLRYPLWHANKAVVSDCGLTDKCRAAFWYDSDITIRNCRINGTQPFCYCRNLIFENCIIEGCDFAFERSSVKADVKGRIESVKNDFSGKITADEIGTLIMDPSVVKKIM